MSLRSVQCAAVCGNVMQFAAACCSVLQYVACVAKFEVTATRCAIALPKMGEEGCVLGRGVRNHTTNMCMGARWVRVQQSFWHSNSPLTQEGGGGRGLLTCTRGSGTFFPDTDAKTSQKSPIV